MLYRRTTRRTLAGALAAACILALAESPPFPWSDPEAIARLLDGKYEPDDKPTTTTDWDARLREVVEEKRRTVRFRPPRVGTEVSFRLLSGRHVSGILRDYDPQGALEIETEHYTFSYSQPSIHPDDRGKLFREACIVAQARRQIQAEKAEQRRRWRREDERLKRRREEVLERDRRIAVEKARQLRFLKVAGERPSTAADGSLQTVKAWVQEYFHDPDSVEYVRWGEPYQGKLGEELYWVVRVRLRARNLMGGKALKDVDFLIRHGVCVNGIERN